MFVLLSVSIVFDTRNEWVHIFQLENGNISRHRDFRVEQPMQNVPTCLFSITLKGNPLN